MDGVCYMDGVCVCVCVCYDIMHVLNFWIDFEGQKEWTVSLQ